MALRWQELWRVLECGELGTNSVKSNSPYEREWLNSKLGDGCSLGICLRFVSTRRNTRNSLLGISSKYTLFITNILSRGPKKTKTKLLKWLSSI